MNDVTDLVSPTLCSFRSCVLDIVLGTYGSTGSPEKRFPTGFPLGFCVVFCVSQERVYVCSTGAPCLVVFEAVWFLIRACLRLFCGSTERPCLVLNSLPALRVLLDLCPVQSEPNSNFNQLQSTSIKSSSFNKLKGAFSFRHALFVALFALLFSCRAPRHAFFLLSLLFPVWRLSRARMHQRADRCMAFAGLRAFCAFLAALFCTSHAR